MSGSNEKFAMADATLAKEERKEIDAIGLSERHGLHTRTDVEPLLSLPGSEMFLNTGTGVIEITHADGAKAYLSHQDDCEHFAQNVGLSAQDKQRLFALESLGRNLRHADIALDEVPLVVSGRFFGPVVATSNGVAIQDTGRGNLVGHDMSKFDKPPKAGDTLDVRYADGLARAAEELSKDNHSVSISMHTR